jgi:hypothetical protein
VWFYVHVYVIDEYRIDSQLSFALLAAVILPAVLPLYCAGIDGVEPFPPIANPMSMYEQYSGPRSTWGIGINANVVVEVVAEDGTYGCGITSGGQPACFIIEHHLSRFVEGRDPRDIELMWCV